MKEGQLHRSPPFCGSDLTTRLCATIATSATLGDELNFIGVRQELSMLFGHLIVQ